MGHDTPARSGTLHALAPVALAKQPAQLYPNPDTATESETEPEPEIRAPSSRPPHHSQTTQPNRKVPTASVGRTTAQPAQPQQIQNLRTSNTRDSRPLSSQVVPPSDAMRKLQEIMNGGGNQEALVEWALHLATKRNSHSDSSRAQPNASSCCTQSGAPSTVRPRAPAAARARTPNQVQCPDRYTRAESPSPEPQDPNSELLPESDELLPASAEAEPIVAEKSGLGRYPGTRHKVATRAIVELLAKATEKGVYQLPETFQKWALNCYRRAWNEHVPDVPYMEPAHNLLQMMVLRISWLRTRVKERIRHVVHYKLGFRHPGTKERRAARNRACFAKLFPNTFHYREWTTDSEQYESTAFVSGICEAFFWDQDSPIVWFPNKFHVMPLPAIAFVLTMMQACLQEWETGFYKSQDLHFPTQMRIFGAHLAGLHEYKASAPQRLHAFQEKWFEIGMQHAGVAIHNPEHQHVQPITRACHVRPDTLLDDCFQSKSPSPELDANGRYTTCSKGKHKMSADSSSGSE